MMPNSTHATLTRTTDVICPRKMAARTFGAVRAAPYANCSKWNPPLQGVEALKLRVPEHVPKGSKRPANPIKS